MVPEEVTYDICRYYLRDLTEVDPALVALVDGYRRSRNLAGLTSCSSHHDRAKHTVGDWRFLRQVEAFFKKNACLANKDVCQQAAEASFHEAEAECSKTNVRLRDLVGFPSLIDERYRHQVRRMASYISRVLGDFSLFLDRLPGLVKVTPGATAHSARRNSLPQQKLGLKPYVTRRAAAILKAVYHYYGFETCKPKICHSNRVELVPKNWKTDRTIACEPEGNLPLQLAFDTYAKQRLRRFGIDLSDQSANQQRARHASVHNDYVTVDFSKASDTIAYNTVQLVFPVEWFGYLDRCRTPGYRGVFGTGVYSKFSSMGNGSTFAIETLLFAAACYAVGAKDFLVYGDDVVIEREFYSAFLELTGFLGFTINEDKSFHDGPFRESCGGDFYGGIDVTPVYIRNIDGRKASLCHLVNSIASVASPNGQLAGYLLKLIQENKLPLAPYSESTLTGVHIDPARARALGILRTRSYISTYRAYTAKCSRKCFVDSRGYYLWFLRKHEQVLFSGPWDVSRSSQTEVMCDEVTETSSVPVFDNKYVRKRAVWREPDGGMPDHLHWWSELVSPR